MELTRELQEHSGLRWVLEQLTPMSPFGRSAARALCWYGPGQEGALEEELDGRLWAGDVCPQAVRRRDSARAAVKVRKRRIEKPP